jgi:hypothetical protein
VTLYKTTSLLLVAFASSLVFGQISLNPTGSPITGDIRPITVQSGTQETNILLVNLAAGASADDNNNNSVTHPIGGAQYFLTPSFAIQETHPRLAWTVSYHPLLKFYVPSSSYPDVFNQVFVGALHYDVTKRLAIGLQQDFLRTFDPFQQLGDTPLQPGIGLLNNPGAVLAENFKRTEWLSQAEIDYRLTKHTSLGVSGDFFELRGEDGEHRSLIGTTDTLGSAYVSHQITARQTVGIQYQFLDIVFPGRDTRARTNGVLLFDQIAITRHLSCAVFGGPEYSRLRNQAFLDIFGHALKFPVSSTLWSPAAGGILQWHRDRGGVQASFVRRVGDGGGVLGAVDMKDAILRAQVRLARDWVADADGEMTLYALLNDPGLNKKILDLGAGITREWSHNWRVRALYDRVHNLGGSESTLPFASHNRVTLQVERDFNVPLGR